MANELKTFMTELADVYREASGTTDKIVPITLPTKYRELLANSGGSDGNLVKHVYFMNEDGSEQLYDKPTISGDDCVDVVAKGLLETPTKESDNYWNYTYGGWKNTPTGSIDSNALKNITEDKTLYCGFNATTRMYTVNFYDGDTLVGTSQAIYGGTAIPPTVTKDGYKIGGYEPSNENITEDRNCYIQWVLDDGIIRDSWDLISQRAKDGVAKNYYKVGDIKDLVINYSDGTTETIPMKLVQFNPTKDDYLKSDKTKNANVVFLANNLLKESRPRGSGVFGVSFGTNELYAYLNNTFINFIPSELSQNLLEVVSDNYDDIVNSNNKGKIWIPNSIEIGYNYSTNSTGGTGQRYSGCTNSDAARKMTKVGSTTGVVYMLRDCISSGSSTGPVGVTASGSITSYGSGMFTQANGVRIGFCL